MSKLFAFDIITKKTYKFTEDELNNFKIEENDSLKEFLGVTEENEKMLYSLFMLGFFDDLKASGEFFNAHYVMLENWLKNWRINHINNKYFWRLSYEMTKNEKLYEYVSDNSTIKTFFYNDSQDTDKIMRDYIFKNEIIK